MKKTFFYLAVCLCLASCADKQDYDATGMFEAQEIILSAEATGKILSFPIAEGQTITQGETLAVIDTLQLHLQREALVLQQRAILQTKPDVNKQVAALREQISKSEKELQRLERLHKADAATQKQVDDANSALAVLRTQLDASLQSLTSTGASIENNAAAIEVQVRQIDDRLAKCRVQAPADGTVLVKYQQAGELAVQGKPLCKIADLNQIYLRAYFTSEQMSNIALGQKVTVVADFGGDEQVEYEGTITWIASDSEFTPKGIQTRATRSNLVYATKIAVKNDGRLKIGFYGEVHL